MRYNEAQQLARNLLIQFDLGDVVFEWGRGKRRLGVAIWKNGYRILRLSKYLVELNDFAEVNDVIRHEIAHFKAGKAAGHGPLWQMWARKCGAKPTRYNTTAKLAEPKYHIVCTACDSIIGGCNRTLKNLDRRYHSKCGRGTVGKVALRRNPKSV